LDESKLFLSASEEPREEEPTSTLEENTSRTNKQGSDSGDIEQREGVSTQPLPSGRGTANSRRAGLQQGIPTVYPGDVRKAKALVQAAAERAHASLEHLDQSFEQVQELEEEACEHFNIPAGRVKQSQQAQNSQSSRNNESRHNRG
jgi:hypothetical protein